MKLKSRSINVYKKAIGSLKQYVHNCLTVGNTGTKWPTQFEIILINVQKDYLAQLAGRAATWWPLQSKGLMLEQNLRTTMWKIIKHLTQRIWAMCSNAHTQNAIWLMIAASASSPSTALLPQGSAHLLPQELLLFCAVQHTHITFCKLSHPVTPPPITLASYIRVKTDTRKHGRKGAEPLG